MVPNNEDSNNPQFPSVEHALGTARNMQECLITVLDNR